jgi:hypothetical protein
MPFVEQISARVGLLGGIAKPVRQRHFDHLARAAGAFACPIAKAASETMHGNIAAATGSLGGSQQRFVGKGTASGSGKDQCIGRIFSERLDFAQQLNRAGGEWHAMRASSLRALVGYHPYCGVEVDFRPSCKASLAATARGQDQEFQRSGTDTGVLAQSRHEAA